MDEYQYHSFKYDLRQLNKSLEKIIELLEVIFKPTITSVDPNRKLTEEAKKENIPFRQPTVFEQDGTTPTTDGNERPFPV